MAEEQDLSSLLTKAYQAVADGDVKTLKECLADGVDVNGTTEELLSQFEHSCLPTLAVICFSRKALLDEERSLSSFASKRQRAGVLRELLKHRLKLKRSEGLGAPELRLTALHILSLGRFSLEERDIVRRLVRLALADGVDPAAKDTRGLTALDLAVLEDQLLVLEELLAAGAGAGAAVYAAQSARHECLRALRNKGFTPEQADAGTTPGKAGPGRPLQAAAAVAAARQPSPQPTAAAAPAPGTAAMAAVPASPAAAPPASTARPPPSTHSSQQLAAGLAQLGLGSSPPPISPPAATAPASPAAAPAAAFPALQALLGRTMGAGALDPVTFGSYLLQCRRESQASQRQALEVLLAVEQGGGLAAVGQVVRQELSRLGAGAVSE
ncbi:hypothetical protein N2152v2_009429 [Parachlorella kessleri]